MAWNKGKKNNHTSRSANGMPVSTSPGWKLPVNGPEMTRQDRPARVMPVEGIDPEELEGLLDDCVELDVKTQIDSGDSLVTFNYKELIQLSQKCKDSNAEMEGIAYISQSEELKHLLTHPVIASFLLVKWYRISLLFYLNVFFYISFFCSLITYVFESYIHPDTLDMTLSAYISRAIFCLTLLILLFRELFQLKIAPANYFRSWENIIEIVLIVFTGCILCKVNILPGDENPISDTKKILSAVSILLASLELILLIGKYPKFSTNVLMLKTVSINFFKFFLWYFLLIVAFALSFYIIFSTDAQEGEIDPFSTPGKSFFKTLVMLTGEFDSGSINFHHFPIVSKIIFLLFIFLIAIILLNLLNGLAVSDIDMIRRNAELEGLITRAQYIRYFEIVITGNSLPGTIVKNFCCMCPVKCSCRCWIKTKSLVQKVFPFPHSLSEMHYKLSVDPKSGKTFLPAERRNVKCERHCYSCCKFYLDKATIKNTNNIVRKKRKSMKSKEYDLLKKGAITNVANINKKIDECFIVVNDINKKIDKHFKEK